MKSTFSLLIIFLLFFISCGKNSDKKINIQSIQNIKYISIQPEKIEVLPSNSSYSGFSGVYGDSIYFFDNYLGYLYLIDTNGQIIKRVLGLGKGPNETLVSFPEKLAIDENSKQLVMLGDAYDIYKFHNFMNRKSLILEHITSDTITKNALSYIEETDMNVSRILENYFYFNIGLGKKILNLKTPQVFDNAHIIMKIDLTTSKATIMGNYSSYYQQNVKKLNQVSNALFDINIKNDFYITFQADSLIYIYDKNFKPIKAYGVEGKNMDKDYKQPITNEWEEFWEVHRFNLINKAYYTWLEYVEEKDMTFRSYTKGSHTDKDGLQIYQDGVLIADVEVPKGLKVAGYIAPYFISQIICDEDNETMHFYRFKLE